MADTQKVGGFAALTMAGTFVIGFVLYFAVLAGSAFESSNPTEVVRFVADHQSLLIAWHLIIYVVFGIALVVLALALHERLVSHVPAITNVATTFGLIWAGLVIASGMIASIGLDTVANLAESDPAGAGLVWTAIKSVQFGIGGGVEIVGALWILLIGWVSLRIDAFSRRIGYASVVIGTAGVITIIPALEIFGALFGLGMIVWFVWIGITLLRTIPDAETEPMARNAEAGHAG